MFRLLRNQTKYHMPGDQILADKGFTLQDELAAACGVSLLMPTFTKGEKQLSAEKVEHPGKYPLLEYILNRRVIGLLKN